MNVRPYIPLLTALCLSLAAVAQDTPAPAAPPAVDAKALTVEQIVSKANQVAYYQGRDGRALVQMEIVDAQGRKREREMTILRLDMPKPGAAADAPNDEDHCGEQRFYVRFKHPADVDKTTFLVWKKPGEDDDRWLYLPALDLVKRVSSADKRSSFVGSNFCYEDVSGRHVAADTHTLVETSANYYVVEAKPKDPAAVEFASFRMWIHRTTFVVVKVEYHDDKDAVYRTYEALGVETIQGHPTVTKARLKDLRTKGETTVVYKDVAYDVGLPAEIFTERYLRQAPRSHMK